MARTSPLWWPWVQRELDARGWSNADLVREIRARVGDGPDESVVGRWKNQATAPTPESVRAVAAVFHRDIRKAFVAASLLTAEDLEAPWADPSKVDLTTVPDEALADEVHARLTRKRRSAPSGPRKRQPASSKGNSPTGPAHRTTVAATGAGGSHHAVPAEPETQTAPPSPDGDEGAGRMDDVGHYS